MTATLFLATFLSYQSLDSDPLGLMEGAHLQERDCYLTRGQVIPLYHSGKEGAQHNNKYPPVRGDGLLGDGGARL